jgi:sugar phosphate isomerase/epimerase
MKIAFSTIVCHEYTLPRIAESARRHGYDGVELYGIEGEKLTPDLLESRLDDVRRDMAGIAVPAIHSWTYLDYRNDDEQSANSKTKLKSQWMSTPVEGQGARAKMIGKAMELAAKLEIPLVKFFGAFPPDDLSLDDAFDAMAETVTPLVKRANELGVTLMVETHDGLPRGLDLHYLLSRVDDPALGAVWDTFHPHRCGEDVNVTDELIGARTVHVHIKDNERVPGKYLDRFKGWNPVAPSEGEVPNKEAVALLHARGYDGYLSVDAERMWEPPGTYDAPEVIMAQYAKAMREYIDAA